VTDDIEAAAAVRVRKSNSMFARNANNYVIGAWFGHVTPVKCEQGGQMPYCTVSSTVTTVAGTSPRVTCPRTCVSRSSNGVLGPSNISVL